MLIAHHPACLSSQFVFTYTVSLSLSLLKWWRYQPPAAAVREIHTDSSAAWLLRQIPPMCSLIDCPNDEQNSGVFMPWFLSELPCHLFPLPRSPSLSLHFPFSFPYSFTGRCKIFLSSSVWARSRGTIAWVYAEEITAVIMALLEGLL